jgi:ferredoxin
LTAVAFFATFATALFWRGAVLIINNRQRFFKEDCPRMAYKITEECIACGACIPECPEEAISEGDPIYIIDPEKCDECGSCADVCPVDCCVPEEEG